LSERGKGKGQCRQNGEREFVFVHVGRN
jgi:hypothetical protein